MDCGSVRSNSQKAVVATLDLDTSDLVVTVMDDDDTAGITADDDVDADGTNVG